MDVGLDIRFLFGPYATAFAAGALFAFCMALIKERYKPKRRDSAPESSVRNPEPEFPDETESAGLTKYSSMGSLCDTKTLGELEFVPRSVPCISNFPAFDGGKTGTGFGGLPCIAKLRNFTFSDDLISLERRFMRYCDGFETPKSHSLPNFQGSRSQPFVLGSVYHQFQSPRRRSRFLGFCNWKPFQQGRKTVSLECPKLPVVYDPNVLTKAAEAVLRNNFRGMESLVLQKGKSLPCLPFKHINMEKSNYDTKCPDEVHRSVDFPPTNSELIEYLSSDQDSNFSETLSQDSDNTTKYQNLHSYGKVCQERITISAETENKWDNFISSDIIKTFENFAAVPNDIENKKMGLETQRNSNKATQNFSHYKEDKILQSYMEIINCSKKLTEFYEKEMSVFEGDVNFLKLKHENINLKTKKKCQGLGKINEKGHKSSYREEQKFSEGISFELKNSYPGNENNLISDKCSMSNNSFVKNACPSTENAIRSEEKTEYSKNQNPCSEEKANDRAPSEFPRALESSFSGGMSKPALRNCHNTGVRIEEEKSINSGIHNLGKIQIRKADEDAKVKKEFLLSLSVQQRRTREEHFAGKPLVTNDRDVTGGGGGREGRAAADDSGREEKRQMDRGTRARSVGGWEVVCAPGRVFESNVSSETVDGVTTTIVSSVSSTTDPWSDIVDATFYDAVDNMSVRTVITTTDGQYRTSQGAPGEHIYVQDKVVVSPTRAAFRIRKPQEQPSMSDKCVPAPHRSNGISHNNDGQAPSDPCSPQDKCTASPVRPTRLKGARGKQTPSPVLSPTGTTKPAIPAKPPHLVRGPLDPPYRPHYEEYMAEGSVAAPPEGLGRPLLEEACSPPRVSRLLGLLSRDEERRKKASIGGEEKEEWDSILSGVLASVSELEKVAKDVGGGADEEDAAEEERDQSAAMDEEAQTVPKEETPTKIKSLRFKLDPDIFDVPSDDSFYDDDVEDEGNMRGWRTRYKGGDEPVRLVSVQASVVPAGQKMTVARPVGIDLRVRLTTEGGKRAHTSPLQQAKRRSPVSDRGWCQELSPVTENVDWRDTFTPNGNSTPSEGAKPVPNGILKTPSPKSEGVAKDSVNPFKEEAKSNGVHADEKQQQQQPPKPNGMTPWNPPQKKFSLPRKKFELDPEAVDRITGYKTAVAKPPLPPPVFLKVNTPPTTRNRAEIARKQYLMDNKAALSASPTPDGSRKFQQFLAQAQSDRERLVTSVPDLAAIEKAVHEKWAREKGSRTSPAREDSRVQPDTPSSRGSTPDDAWSSYVQTCRKHLGRRSQSMSYLETDVDLPPVDEDKWSSTTALDHPDSDHPTTVDDSSDFGESQEDLNDSGRAKSEHELRIQRSLQSLPLPDWYKRSDKPKTGFLLKSSERKEKRGWAAAKSLASSTSSLASCGVKRPVHSLRSSRENIPWSRSSPSPDGPALSLALSRAFREPYMGWRARTSTTSSGVSSSPNSSWCGGRSTTDEEAIHGISFDGEDVDCLGKTTSSEEGGRRDEPPSPDDTGADAVTVSMDTGDLVKLPGGEDTCDDINNMSMDTCELFDAGIVMDELPSIVLAPGGESSPQADTGDDIDNLSTDTTTDSKRKDTPWKDTTTESLSKVNGGTVDSYSIRRDTDSISQSGKCPSMGNMSDSVHSRSNGSSKDPKSKRYSYSRSIYHSEWGEEESRGDRKGRAHKDPSPTSPDSKVIWIESSFVGSRTTTSIVVLPQGRESKVEGDCVERPASR